MSTTNQTAAFTECELCHGDKFVTVRLRAPEPTHWTQAHRLKPSSDSFHEEVAPCPDCNPQQITVRRHDGSWFVGLDPAAVRQMLA